MWGFTNLEVEFDLILVCCQPVARGGLCNPCFLWQNSAPAAGSRNVRIFCSVKFPSSNILPQPTSRPLYSIDLTAGVSVSRVETKENDHYHYRTQAVLIFLEDQHSHLARSTMII
jgi:hypothetical protein